MYKTLFFKLCYVTCVSKLPFQFFLGFTSSLSTDLRSAAFSSVSMALKLRSVCFVLAWS